MLRFERDLSQKEVANRLYVSDVTISRAERGELSMETFINLCNLYGVVIDFLPVEFVNDKNNRHYHIDHMIMAGLKKVDLHTKMIILKILR